MYWSTANRTLYLGLDRYGHPKKVQAKGHNLGRLSANARVLTQVAPPDRVENLQRRILGAHHKVRHWYHHRQICDDVQPNCPPKVSAQEKDGRDRFRCRKRKKRKKRRRWCRPGEQPGPQCQVAEESAAESTDLVEASSEIMSTFITTPESKRSCEGAASEEACRRQALSVPAKKRKSRIDGGGRNLTLGKNKASTSNAKKPNVSVADNQSKKPDLTDGKKKKKRTPQQTSRGSVAASPSRKQYGPGTTSSSRASSSLTAPGSEEQRASTATLSSSPSLPGASTALFSITRPSSPQSDHKRPPLSSRNHIARPIGLHRVGKSFRGNAGLPDRSKSMPAISTTPGSKIASTTKVPQDTCAYATTPLPQFSPVLPSSSPSWQESDESWQDTSQSYSSLVDEDSSSMGTSELAIVQIESSTLAASDDVVAEVTTFESDEKNYEDSDVVDMIPQTTTRFPLEKLAM